MTLHALSIANLLAVLGFALLLPPACGSRLTSSERKTALAAGDVTFSVTPKPTLPAAESADPFYLRLQLDASVIESTHKEIGNRDLAARNSSLPMKIAFIFLTYKELQLPALWEAFFADAPNDAYTIYIHQVKVKDTNTSELPLAKFGAVRIPHVKSSWCAIGGLEVHALATAMMSDAANRQFVLIGDTTVPLKSFEYVQQHLLLDSPDKSKFCPASESLGKTWREELGKDPKPCLFNDFLGLYNSGIAKHHQWMVLAREHAAKVVQHAIDGLSVFEEAHRSMPIEMKGVGGCSDEVLPLAALLQSLKQEGKSSGNAWADLSSMGVERHCTTFVGWMHCLLNTKLSLGHVQHHTPPGNATHHKDEPEEDPESHDFPHKFVEIDESYLEQLVLDETFLFARKFMRTSKVKSSTGALQDLVSILPAMWKKPADPSREQRIWTSLDTKGQPTVAAAKL